MTDNPTQFRQYALQGFLLGLLPLEILTVYADNPYLTVAQEQMAGGAAAVLLITAAAVISKYRRWGQVLGTAGIMLNLFLLSGELIQEPLAAMAELLLSLAALYYLFTARLSHVQTVSSSLQLERVIGCSGGCVLLGISSPLLSGEWELFALVCAVSLFILLIIIGKYCRLKRYFLHRNMVKSLLFAAAAALGVAAWYGAGDLAAFLAAPVVLIAALRQKHADLKYLPGRMGSRTLG